MRRKLSNSRYQMDALDGLRGIAALIVVLSHTSNEGWYLLPYFDFSGTGKAGVYLFFLLSSFLLSLPLFEKGKSFFSVPAMAYYWQRRIFRIYPLYITYLLCGLITTVLFTKYLGTVDRGAPFELNLLEFLAHLTLQQGKGVTWSIAVEFKFYFLLPIFIGIATFARKISWWFPAVVMVLLIILLQQFFPQHELNPNDVRIMYYMPVFLIGIICAIIQSKIRINGGLPEKLKLPLKILGILSALSIILMTPSLYSVIRGEVVATNLFHKHLVSYTLLWAFIMMVSINCNGLLQSFFKLKIFTFLGAISFSLYLIHPIFIGAINFIEIKGFDINGILAAWSVFLVTIPVSIVTFKVIEEPMSKINLWKNTSRNSGKET